MSSETKTYTVVCQEWVERERGWGIRPDGYSLHGCDNDRKVFIDLYWKAMPSSPPDEYSTPHGEAFLLDVDKSLYDKVSASERGIWFHGEVRKNDQSQYTAVDNKPGKPADDIVWPEEIDGSEFDK